MTQLGRKSQTQPRRFAAIAVACFTLVGCASVPLVDESDVNAHATGDIQMVGARGPLSKRQSEAILHRLAAQAPDAGALERHLALEQAVAENPLVAGNQVHILRDGQQTFPAMFAAIHAARRYLYLEYYIFEDVSCNGESLGDLLVAKAQSGVQIDLIYDGIGSIGTPSEFFSRLSDAGVRIVQFNPPNPLKAGWHFRLNDRDHRKMLIADGNVSILGGVNMSSTYESAPSGVASSARAPARDNSTPNPPSPGADKNQDVWHDTDLEIDGPVVGELEKLFREHWREQGGPDLQLPDETGNSAASAAQPAGTEVVRIIGSAPRRLKARYYVTVLSAIRNAESSVWITAAYFAPTRQEKLDLMRAARRGVDVRLLLPSRSDSPPALQVQHSHYSSLLRAGVKIFERNDGILHSKSMVVDGVWSITGSSNFDHRSVLFNDEVDAVVLGSDTGGRLAQLFLQDLEHAQAIDLASWRQRSTITKLREQFWRLWEKLL